MKSYKLSFATIYILKNNLVEIIADEGVVMDEVEVDELHDFLLSNIDSPQLLLINKKYSYSYTFKAQTMLASLREIKAVAVTHSSAGALLSTESLIGINQSLQSKVKIFQNREQALEWLNTL